MVSVSVEVHWDFRWQLCGVCLSDKVIRGKFGSTEVAARFTSDLLPKWTKGETLYDEASGTMVPAEKAKPARPPSPPKDEPPPVPILSTSAKAVAKADKGPRPPPAKAKVVHVDYFRVLWSASAA